MKIKTMHDLYVSLLQDTYDSEKQLCEALPKMADAAITPELQEAFEDHLEETRMQVERLEQVFELLAIKPEQNICEATQGLVKEAEELIKENAEPGVMDAGLIAAAQKVEHYEIASYGTLCELAKILGYSDQQDLLHETLNEEKGADKTLTSLATSHINRLAQAA